MGWSRLRWMEPGPGCAPGLPVEPAEGNVPPLLQLAQVKLCEGHRDLSAPAGTKAHTHTLLQLSTEGLQHVVGLGKARKFSAENSVDWTLLTATSQKKPSVSTAACPFFVVAIESQHFCRDLHFQTF